MKIYGDQDADLKQLAGKIAVMGYGSLQVGAKLRALMPWLASDRLVVRTKN